MYHYGPIDGWRDSYIRKKNVCEGIEKANNIVKSFTFFGYLFYFYYNIFYNYIHLIKNTLLT